MISKDTIKASYAAVFGQQPQIIAKSPGRINIIGEHTDYNNGFVLPAAIDKYIYVAMSPRSDLEIHLYAEDYKESYSTTLNTTALEAPEWAKYIIGVTHITQQRANTIQGFNLYLCGDVPLGAGLSSSAALSCATGYALNELFDIGLSRIEIAKIGQQTEHEYIGLKCGIMDQFASVLGKESQAIKLDCNDLSYEYVPIDWAGYEILLLNTNVKHNLASTAYNDRRNACEQGVKWIQEVYPSVETLRDVQLDQLDRLVKSRDIDVYTKCRFVVQENMRLLDAVKALKNKDMLTLGKLLFDAHWALSKEYEVSCPELDFLVQEAENNESVIGSRMMGGGFGGCTINILKKDQSQKYLNNISVRYKEKFGRDLTPIQVEISNGSSLF